MFTRNGTVWEKQTKLVGSQAGEMFGSSLDISGDHAIVSSYNDDDGGTAYLFERDGDSWTEILREGGGPYFAENVAISESGNHIAMSNYDLPPLIMKRNGAEWEQQNTDGVTTSFSTIRISDDNALIASYWTNQAFWVRRDGTSWKNQKELSCPEGVTGFGASASFSGDHAVVGADNSESKDGHGGRAYVYCLSEACSEDCPAIPNLLNASETGSCQITWDAEAVNAEAVSVLLCAKNEANEWVPFSALKIAGNSGKTCVTIPQEAGDGIWRLGLLAMPAAEEIPESGIHWVTNDFAIGDFAKGDVSADGEVTPADLVLSLQIAAGKFSDQMITTATDVNGDTRIGVE